MLLLSLRVATLSVGENWTSVHCHAIRESVWWRTLIRSDVYIGPTSSWQCGATQFSKIDGEKRNTFVLNRLVKLICLKRLQKQELFDDLLTVYIRKFSQRFWRVVVYPSKTWSYLNIFEALFFFMCSPSVTYTFQISGNVIFSPPLTSLSSLLAAILSPGNYLS